MNVSRGTINKGRSMSETKCPECGREDAELVVDEVDIGIGVMSHPRYIFCLKCGEVSLPEDPLPKRKGLQSE